MVESLNERQSMADWPEPLTAPQLVVKLRELAEVARRDVGHDFGTVFDTFSSRERMAKRLALSLSECQQILRAVRESAPEVAMWRSDLMALNKYLFDKRRDLSLVAAGEVLPRLFRAAAERIETPPPDRA